MGTENFNNVAYERMESLVDAGYEVDKLTSGKVVGSVWLDNPSSKIAGDIESLIVSNDGMVVSNNVGYPDTEQVRIYEDQDKEFEKFLLTIPKPTYWEKTERSRYEYFAYAIFFGIPLILWFLFK